jgi:hypothetical protein
MIATFAMPGITGVPNAALEWQAVSERWRS